MKKPYVGRSCTNHVDLFIHFIISVVEAVATACYTHKRSLIHPRFNKTPYELIYNRKPELKYLHEFGSLCYPLNDREDLGKLKAKGDLAFLSATQLNPKHTRYTIIEKGR